MDSKKVSAVMVCAALYGTLSLPTAWVELPWLGHGQFRPALVIPAVFAVLFGPVVGALGGAMGTLICDCTKHMTLYIPSLIAGAPGNLVGFYILGHLAKRFTWRGYVLGSSIGITAGCGVITVGMAAYGSLFGIVNLITLPWLIPFFLWIATTGLISLIVLGPPLLKVIFKAFPHLRPLPNYNSR